MVAGTGRCTPPFSRPVAQVPGEPALPAREGRKAGRGGRLAGLHGKLDPAGLEYRHQLGSVADNPAVGDQAVPAGQSGTPHPSGAPKMLRLQAPLPDRYTRASADELDAWIADAKAQLGDRLVILGHHYQRDEVIKWADARGDSFKLARFAADDDRATDIVFCGVHFMAESADVLTGDHQRVILPDLNAGCSMADMADIDQVEECWDALADVTDVSDVVPITYMNSSAALKAFVGEHGGAVCTSSNARAVLDWALAKGSKVLFFPDQHLGRNTGYDMGYGEADMRVWNPRFELGGLEERDVKEATLLLWKGHCSVHQRFRPEHVAAFRPPRRGGAGCCRRRPRDRHAGTRARSPAPARRACAGPPPR